MKFDPVPIASASLTQVHVARTHQGEKVVVKVQHMHMTDTIATDYATVELIVNTLHQLFPSFDYSKEHEHLLREADDSDLLTHHQQFITLCAQINVLLFFVLDTDHERLPHRWLSNSNIGKFEDTKKTSSVNQAIAEKELMAIVAFVRAYETTYQRQPETRIFLINGHRTKGENSNTQLKIYSKKRKAIETTGLQKTMQNETDMKTPTKKQK
ncbi:hypothetical protein L6452_27342 [Arctium lappa]|uniref:Uncharacterized protein n=1 Tax=Arctium lappa TaxID=4217 RepID=A0ACB8ZX43_ARCLA|nr:hypothetical protein L6452_27342 [Arctium lappa]